MPQSSERPLRAAGLQKTTLTRIRIDE